MALSYKTRRRLALLILVVGVPAYIVIAVTLVNALQPVPPARMSLLLEFIIYVALGVVWAIPLRFIFKGVGQADPDAPPPPNGDTPSD